MEVKNLKMNSSEFRILSEIVYNVAGIKLPEQKQVMLESRLNRRLNSLGLRTFKEYIDYLETQDDGGDELERMINNVTTNKTDFFREPQHFNYIYSHIIPSFLKQGKSKFKIWSAACSSGEEPYTIAMVLNDFSNQCSTIDFSILASDISTDVLRKAYTAVYNIDRVEDLSMEIKRKYFLISKEKKNVTVRITPEIRKRVVFDQINLMDQILPVEDKFDLLFCRNALIYFDKDTQMEVVKKLVDKINPGGYFFIGHSESLFQHSLPLKQVMPTVYQKI